MRGRGKEREARETAYLILRLLLQIRLIVPPHILDLNTGNVTARQQRSTAARQQRTITGRMADSSTRAIFRAGST